MAQRDLTNDRSVIQQVAEQPDALLNQAASIAEGILRQGEEAKLTENFSQAQLDLSALDSRYRLDNQGDPTNKNARSKYDADRQKIYDGLGGNISPFYKRQWQDNTRQLNDSNDATRQAWALKQTQVNSVSSVNKAMQNGLRQATLDGEALGAGVLSIEDVLVNHANSVANLNNYAQANLGETTGTEAVKDYNEDWLKTTISSMSLTDPVGALAALDVAAVKNSFTDLGQWQDMKKSIGNRALNVQTVKGEQAVLDILTTPNSLLAASVNEGKVMDHTSLQVALEGQPSFVKSYFMKANGYGSGGEDLSDAEKFKNKADLYAGLSELSRDDNLGTDAVKKIQESIYKGMENKTLTGKEGAGWINQFVSPAIKQAGENLSKFETKNLWVFDGGGFSDLDEVLDQVLIPKPKGEELDDLDILTNNKAKVTLYEFYTQELVREATARKIDSITGLSSLPSSEKRSIYNKAQNSAKNNFWKERYPKFGGLENVPPTIITGDGRKIVTGVMSDAKPSSSVSADFEVRTGADGKTYHIFPDGTYEVQQ